MNLKENANLLKKERFGVEIEMGCISIQNTVTLIAAYFNSKYGSNSQPQYDGGHYREWSCKDHRGRKWKGMSDGSSPGTAGSISCEMVTPILEYDDIEDLQELVRIFRRNGAKSGAEYNAGVHIHIDDNFGNEGGQSAKSIRNLVNIINSHDQIITKAISVSSIRTSWCRPVDSDFLNRMNTQRPQTYEGIGACWYGSRSEYDRGHFEHYHRSRYKLLNLHSMFYRESYSATHGKGIEFRCFEFHRGLHAGELKAWIQFCCAICSYAKLVNYSRSEPVDMANEKYAMNSWLKNLGLIGDEFKTCRKHMLKRLSGDTAYRNGRPDTDEDELIDVLTAC